MTALEWLQVFLSYFLQVAVVLSVAWAIDIVCRTPRTTCRLWTSCYLCLLLLLVAALCLPRLRWIHPWSQLTPAELMAWANAECLLARGLLGAWLLGILMMLVTWGYRYCRLRKLIKSCIPITSDKRHVIAGLVDDRELTIRGKPIEIRVGSEQWGSFCYQFHRPLIVVPASLVHGDLETLRYVIRHELAHLQTEHPRQLFLQQLLQTVLWFHPLVWLSGRRAALVREFVCDEVVADGEASMAAYLRALLQIVEQKSRIQSGTLAIGPTRSQLRCRVERLNQSIGTPRLRTSWWPAITLAVCALMVSQFWLPTNPLASSRARWSPWPKWTAATLHCFEISVCDFDVYDERTRVEEILGGSLQIDAD